MVPWVADVQTAVVAKEALEGHCIYDGGFCKLHLSYSRHSDLSIKVTRHALRIKFFFPAHHDTVYILINSRTLCSLIVSILLKELRKTDSRHI
jgi:hypothetical protein